MQISKLSDKVMTLQKLIISETDKSSLLNIKESYSDLVKRVEELELKLEENSSATTKSLITDMDDESKLLKKISSKTL